jgi:hypothetical protein
MQKTNAKSKGNKVGSPFSSTRKKNYKLNCQKTCDLVVLSDFLKDNLDLNLQLSLVA